MCFRRPAYTFNTNCRNILEVNGLVIDSSYKNVMIVVAALDGNDGILLIALCSGKRGLYSWYFFLENLVQALHKEYGEGLYIMIDGDNGFVDVVEA